MTRYQAIEVSAEGPVGVLRLSRPELHNRFDDTLFGEIRLDRHDVRGRR